MYTCSHSKPYWHPLLAAKGRHPHLVDFAIEGFVVSNIVPIHPQRSSDDSLSQESGSEFGKVGELQEVVDRQTADLGQMKERMAAMVSRINELEEDLDTARKDLIKSEDMNTRQQRDLREVGGTFYSQYTIDKRYIDVFLIHVLNFPFTCSLSSV